MNWKHWPYWLRGGVIGGGVTLVSVFLFYSCILLDTSHGSFLCLPFLFISPMFPFIDLFDTNPYFHALPVYSMEVTSIVIYFISGSLLGLLVGYIKKKKNLTQ